ncbi:MAG: hypothetical protein Q8K32_31880 [Archangium sp.]|nr:hypothetical protein [Archangium sp.]
MAEQLNILGLWERTPDGPKEPEKPVELPPPPPIDPRQEELLSGAHTLKSRLEDACVALDAEALRAAHAELISQYGEQSWASHAPAWATAIEPLGAAAPETLLSLEPLPSMSPALFERVRASALLKAAVQLGAGGTLADGRPAGYLALVAGDFPLARKLLSNRKDARSLGYLGEAAWRQGDAFAALQAYCRASLVGEVDQAQLSCQPVMELLDLGDELELEAPFAWLAVLADLSGKHALGEFEVNESAPVRAAALLRAYRRDRSTLDEAGRIVAKRELARVAPAGLRELIRRL